MITDELATIQGLRAKELEFFMFDIFKILLACAVVVPFNAAVAQSSVVRFDGIGAVRLGMSLPDLNRTLNTSYSKPSNPEEQSCYYVDVPNQPGVGIMMLDGRAARVDVDNTTTRTARGVHIGDSEARALRVYGRKLRVEPQQDLEINGHYLTLFSSDRKYGIRFETEDGKITRYYAGVTQAIAFIEGCS